MRLIGDVALQFNHTMAALPPILALCGVDGDIATALYRSNRNDREFRKVVRISVQSGMKGPWQSDIEPTRQQLLKLLKELDQLADERNTAVHELWPIPPHNEMSEEDCKAFETKFTYVLERLQYIRTEISGLHYHLGVDRAIAEANAQASERERWMNE